MATDIEPDYEFEVDPSADDALARISRKIAPGSEILELGPARGYLTRHLAGQLGCRVDCIERSERMAGQVRPHARRLILGDLDELDVARELGAASYDAIIAADVLEHLKNPARTLESCRLLLRPGGKLLLSAPNVGHASVALDLLEGRFTYRPTGILDRTHRWFYTRESLLDLLREAGWAVDELERVVRMPETTEFQRRLDTVPPNLRDHLLRHPDALTYQFVVSAHVGTMSAERWSALREVAQPAELVFPVKVYWAPPEGEFTESQHVAGFARIGEMCQRIVFDLPARESIARLRVDPTDRPGFLRLHSFTVSVDDRGGSGDRTVVEFPDARSLAAGVAFEGITVVSHEEKLTFVATTADPFFVAELDVPLPESPNRRAILEMSWPASADFDVTRRWIESATRESDARVRETEKLAAREVGEAREKVHQLEQSLLETRRQSEALAATLREMLASRGWRALEWLRGWKRLVLPGR